MSVYSIRLTLKKLNQSYQSLQFSQVKPKLNTTAQRLAKQVKATGQPQARDLKQLQQKYLSAIQADNWENITLQEWRQAVWLLWYGKKADHLAQHGEFLNQLWTYVLDNPILLKRMIRIYFYEFNLKKANIDTVGDFIQQALKEKLKNKQLQHWKKQHNKYRLFEPERGIQLVTGYCLKQQPIDALVQLGFKGELLNSEYVKTLYQHALQQLIRQKNGDRQTLEKILIWSEENHKLRYPDIKRKLVQALLTPWQQVDPPPETKHRIQIFLLKHIQDPRTHSQSWHGISKPLIKVMYRWLIGTTLDTFIEILDQCILDKHWQYRRAFWWAYYEREYIDEAWLALGSAAQSFLKLNPELHETVYAAYANLVGANIRTNHCVLLFRIKNLIIAEWSHHGRCHIWLNNNPDAPQFYEPEYTREAVTQHSEKIKAEYNYTGISHHSNEMGGWQVDIATFIAEHTDISLQAIDYMPKILD